MRILAGRFKDTPIPFKAQPGLRPTPDKVRKALMDALMPWEGKRVLDLFAGTGALGLEALSAGAEGVILVEADRKRASQIEKMLDELGLGAASRVLADDVAAALAKLAKSGEVFDRVLADPPYEKGLALQVLDFFKNGTALNAGAWLAIETYKKEAMPDAVDRLARRKTALYGDTAIHYYVLT